MLTEEQIMDRATRVRELADDLKEKIAITVTPEGKRELEKDYWFYKGKLEAYKETIKG